MYFREQFAYFNIIMFSIKKPTQMREHGPFFDTNGFLLGNRLTRNTKTFSVSLIPIFSTKKPTYPKCESMVRVFNTKREDAARLSVLQELLKPCPNPLDDGGAAGSLKDDQSHNELQGHGPEHRVPLYLKSSWR